MGHRPSAPRDDRHAKAIIGVTPDGRIHGAGQLLESIKRDAPVLPRAGVGRQLLRKAPVRFIGLGTHEKPRRVLIDAVHDAGPFDAVDGRKRAAVI